MRRMAAGAALWGGASLLVQAFCASHAFAGDALPGLASSDKPEFYFTGYLWASAINGQAATLPPLPPANVNLSFGDILSNFDGGIMGSGEIRFRRWSAILDTMWTQVSPNATLSGPLQSDVTVRTRSWTVQGDLLYRAYQNSSLALDAGGGWRFWNLNNRISFDPASPGDGRSYSYTENWVDPLLAARLSVRIRGPWSATFMGDVGGFNVGSQLTYQLVGTLNYQITQDATLRVGYRMLSVNYEQGNYLYNVLMQGPIIGLTYHF